jgi:hypothetical protein
MKDISREGNCLLAIAKDKKHDCVKPADITVALKTNQADKVQEDLLKILAFFLDVEVIHPMICIQLANQEITLSEEELRKFT